MKKVKSEKRPPNKLEEIDVEDTVILEGVVEPENEVKEFVESEIEKVKKINAELIDKCQRSIAEFDNFRKRTIKEKSNMYNDGVKDTVEKLLPIVDNFERALKSLKDKDEEVYKGIEMISRQFNSILDELGVKSINAQGEKFDTNFHFAVLHIEDENYSENEVVEELQKGYTYKDKVIRCSMVKVAN